MAYRSLWSSSTDELRGILVSVIGPARGGLHALNEGAPLRSPRPSNPTARSTRPGRSRIGRSALDAGLWVLTDEIYEHLVYEGVTAPSMPVVVARARRTCVVINGVAKTYAMTGWRVGWIVGPADIIKAATNLQSHATSNVANVSQAAAVAALTGDLSAAATMREAFDQQQQLIVSMLREIPGIACPEPQGAFYVYPSVKGLLGRPIAGRTAETSADLATLILEEAEVAVVPGEAFGTPGYVRMSYALGDDDLVEGVTRMQRLLASAGGRPPPERGTSSLPSACASISGGSAAAGRSARAGVEVLRGGDRPGGRVDVAADRGVERIRAGSMHGRRAVPPRPCGRRG